MSVVAIIRLGYLLAAVLFILGLKLMSQPRTAVRGNRLGALGMGLAIGATMLSPEIGGCRMILVGLLVGSLLGAWLAITVRMTAMPQMVALLNGLGGGSSLLVGGAELWRLSGVSADVLAAIAASAVIGGVTLTGSLVAMWKLDELGFVDRYLRIPNQQWANAALAILALALSVALVRQGGGWHLFGLLSLVASILGVYLVSAIGGADMPVVIALLNSYSGLAAAATGFVIDNDVLIISGSLVGASGIILSQIMCRAMNRSLVNVLFGSMSTGSDRSDADAVYAQVRSTSAEDVAMILDAAQRVVIVPGYGMAVAQAQHAVRDLTRLLMDKKISVEFAIHPVAGRMPGHMNVLLAEADIPYTQLIEMDAINPGMETVDVAIVLGANDVVNPVARTDPRSPIAGMPIIDVDKARTVIVIKRSLSPGFAGIPNPLFAAPNALVFFADGRQAILEIVAALKAI